MKMDDPEVAKGLAVKMRGEAKVDEGDGDQGGYDEGILKAIKTIKESKDDAELVAAAKSLVSLCSE